jgi:hypothetical protein
MHWRFKPATLDGRPVAQALTVVIDFQLPKKQSRWHLVGASFHLDPGVTLPSPARVIPWEPASP